VNRIQAGGSGVRIPVGTRDFALLQKVQTDSGAHLASYTMGTGVLSRGVKRPDHDVYHSPPSSDEIRNEWRYTSTPLAYLLYGLERYSCTFTFFTKTNEILKIENGCVLKRYCKKLDVCDAEGVCLLHVELLGICAC
jgi:hypothetical protein